MVRRAARLLGGIVAAFSLLSTGTAADTVPKRAPLADYVVIGWNDLGMHCLNDDFEGMAILPPFNNLWAQVVKRGPVPELISSGVELVS